ncbi:MAG: hypothetical protein ABSA67_13670 [Candidatus Brocadiia bacterium]|jgi:hypothetical protein
MSRPGRRARLALRLSCGFFCLLLVTGCASTGVARSDGTAQWSGLGLTLKLPPGGWQIEPQGENAVLFKPQGRAGNLLIERVKTRPKEPEWLALKKLLSSFDAKKEISQRAERLPNGESALRAEFDVQVTGGGTRLVAYLIPRAGFTYEIIEWNVGRDELAERFLAGLAPAAKSGPVPRTP